MRFLLKNEWFSDIASDCWSLEVTKNFMIGLGMDRWWQPVWLVVGIGYHTVFGRMALRLSVGGGSPACLSLAGRVTLYLTPVYNTVQDTQM